MCYVKGWCRPPHPTFHHSPHHSPPFTPNARHPIFTQPPPISAPSPAGFHVYLNGGMRILLSLLLWGTWFLQRVLRQKPLMGFR